MALNDFTQYALENVSITNPTSLEFGADGRLYVTQQDGLIKALEIQKKATGGYTVISEETITLVKDMPNHNDDGSLAANVLGRQVTGVVTTTNELGQVVLYVSSSDSRIAGGASGDDSGLDTNSGIISRLTLTPSGWEKVDIVRGLPRSEENHSVNGMQLTQINGVPTLLVAVGGNTNQGAQSNNFSHTNEYYYSASVVAIDLAKIDALEALGVKTYAPAGYAAQNYIFDLPTLDDPTRTNGANGADLAESGTAGGDPFGGNDGLNQAIYDPTGVVQVYSSGYRNIYDVVVTQDGKLYTYDNGPNSGWGGLPVNTSGQVIVDANGDGVPDNGPATTLRDVTAVNNAGTSKPDQLHLIDPTIHDGPGTSYIDGTPYNSDVYLSQGLGYYGGHPNLTRAYGTQAGLYLYNEAGQPLTIVNGELVVSTTGPVDLGPMIANWSDIVGQDDLGNEFIDPRQAVYLSPKPNDGSLPFDGSLHSIGSSTNGITEYVFNGSDINKALLTVSFNGNLTALILGADGKVIGTQTRGIGGNPLDVTSQKDGEVFGGTIWVATHGSDKIFILDPDSGQGIIPDPTDRDMDDVEDTFDPFVADPSNGLDNVINANETLTWEFVPGAPFPNQNPEFFDGATGLYNGFDIGFTGIMTDGTGLPESFYNPENLIAGGAPGAFQIKKVEAGDPFANSLRGGYQFGIVPGGDTGVFTVTTQMDSYFDEISTISANAKLLQGLFVGSGDMDNFVYIAAVRQADGKTGIEVAWEFEQPFQPNATGSAFYQIDALGAATGSDYIKVSFAVDSDTGVATPEWEFTSGGQTYTQDDFIGPIESVQLAGEALDALHGQNDLDKKSGGTAQSGFSVGILATNSAGGAVEGNIVAAVNAGGNDYTAIVNGQSVTFLSDKPGGAANPWVTGAYKSFTPSTTFDIQGTDLDTLHLTERSHWGTWGYAVPVVNGGTYDLDLYFAEIYFGAPGGAAGGIGKREFKIKIEGQYVDIPGLTDGKLDIYELVGAARELVLSYDITENANDGNSTLDIQFETVTNQAKLSGFVVREGSSAPTFAADWENITVTGEPKAASTDQTPPTASMTIIPAPADDGQFQVTVVFTDLIAMNPDSVQGTDLTMSGPSAGELVGFEKTVSADGKTVTATYAFAPTTGAWLNGNYAFQIAAGAVQDWANNGNTFTSASVSYGAPVPGYAPEQDLDGDGVANKDDNDIDGDGQLNGDDTFAYDSDDDGHGVAMTAGQVIRLDFNTAGTPYQNGFTGVMASSNPAFKTEDTGSGSVSGGKLHVTTTNGDTGTANTPQNSYQLGIKNASFTVEGVFDNPYFGTGEVPNNFEQLGLQISVHSDAFAKFVFGSPGANIEFSQDSGTLFKTSFANGKTLADFAQAKLEMAVKTVGTTSTATATITLLDADGNVIPGGGPTVVGTLTLNPTLAAALQQSNQPVGVGVTSTHIGGDAFTWSMDYLQVKEGVQEPPPLDSAEEILAAQTDLVTTDTYSGTAVGAAVMKILPGNNNVQSSNFGNNSFTLENIGDKKISGVFIDVSSAIYGDVVFDDDGSGGDSVAKDIAYQTSAGTGAISPSTYGHFFFQARDPANPDPLFDNALSDSGKGADGGYRGLLLKYSSSDGGFQTGELVGFSGDMDSNSIAGLLKSTVDGNSVPAWDVGGVSGAELIGSSVTIMFSDGTMATGQLMSDGSQAGAQALITQSTSGSGQVAGLTVNGVEPGENGTYGGVLPDVIVTGPAGATVRVVMTRGFDPVESQIQLNGGATTVDELVEDRLAAYDFKVNNAADFQTVDVVIPASGSLNISQMFKYNTAPNNFTGIPDYNKLPVGFVAAVVDPANGGLPIGPVTEPIYLQNNGTPVQVDGTGPAPSSYYMMEGNRLKVQVEDAAGGANPPAGWVFQNDADGGNQTGFQGSGYYYWKSEMGTAVNAPQGSFTASFYVASAGTYTLRARSSRDTNSPSDARNDVWVKIDNNAEALLPAGTADIVSNSGFVKLFGASTGWGFSSQLDTVSNSAPNIAAKFNLSAGFHTITFAGRSEGYHLDFFELYQGTAPAINASNSPLITGGNANVAPSDISLSNQSVTEEQAGAVVGNVSVVDPNAGDTHIVTVNDNRFEVVGGQLKLKTGISLDFETEPSVSVTVTATDTGGLSLSETFVIGVNDDPSDNEGLTFAARVVNANGDIEQGSPITSPDLETNKVIGIQFTVPDGIDLAAGAVIESAVISWVSDRTHTANSTLTFAVESKLNGATLSTGVTNRTYLPETEVWNASGTWTDGQKITVGIDLANQLNALIQSDGLQAGDVITVKVTGTGGIRYIEAAGGGRTPAELTITVPEAQTTALAASSEKLAFADGIAPAGRFLAHEQEKVDRAAYSDTSDTDGFGTDWAGRGAPDFHVRDWMDGHYDFGTDYQPFIG